MQALSLLGCLRVSAMRYATQVAFVAANSSF
jgi:hypothetical protein